MPIDNRKKKEELQEVVQEAIAEPVVEEIVLEEPPVESLKENINVEEPIKEPEVKAPEVVEETKEEVIPSLDYKEKYQDSTKEAMTLYSKNKRLVEKVEEANTLPEPTEDECVAYARKSGTNYDDLDDFTKTILKETLHNKMKFEKINDLVKETKDIDAWADKIDAFTNSVETVAKYPLIEENADDFRKFSLQKEHRGADMEMLAAAYLYKQGTISVKKSKGSMLLSGSGGGKVEKPVGLTDEDVKNIRLTNPKELRRLIKAGKVNIEI